MLWVIGLRNLHVVNGGCVSGFYCDVNVNLDIYVNYVTIKEVGNSPSTPLQSKHYPELNSSHLLFIKTSLGNVTVGAVKAICPLYDIAYR